MRSRTSRRTSGTDNATMNYVHVPALFRLGKDAASAFVDQIAAALCQGIGGGAPDARRHQPTVLDHARRRGADGGGAYPARGGQSHDRREWDRHGPLALKREITEDIEEHRAGAEAGQVLDPTRR